MEEKNDKGLSFNTDVDIERFNLEKYDVVEKSLRESMQKTLLAIGLALSQKDLSEHVKGYFNELNESLEKILLTMAVSRLNDNNLDPPAKHSETARFGDGE